MTKEENEGGQKKKGNGSKKNNCVADDFSIYFSGICRYRSGDD